MHNLQGQIQKYMASLAATSDNHPQVCHLFPATLGEIEFVFRNSAVYSVSAIS